MSAAVLKDPTPWSQCDIEDVAIETVGEMWHSFLHGWTQ